MIATYRHAIVHIPLGEAAQATVRFSLLGPPPVLSQLATHQPTPRGHGLHVGAMREARIQQLTRCGVDGLALASQRSQFTPLDYTRLLHTSTTFREATQKGSAYWHGSPGLLQSDVDGSVRLWANALSQADRERVLGSPLQDAQYLWLGARGLYGAVSTPHTEPRTGLAHVTPYNLGIWLVHALPQVHHVLGHHPDLLNGAFMTVVAVLPGHQQWAHVVSNRAKKYMGTSLHAINLLGPNGSHVPAHRHVRLLIPLNNRLGEACVATVLTSLHGPPPTDSELTQLVYAGFTPPELATHMATYYTEKVMRRLATLPLQLVEQSRLMHNPTAGDRFVHALWHGLPGQLLPHQDGSLSLWACTLTHADRLRNGCGLALSDGPPEVWLTQSLHKAISHVLTHHSGLLTSGYITVVAILPGHQQWWGVRAHGGPGSPLTSSQHINLLGRGGTEVAAYRHVRLLIPLSRAGEVSAITSLLGPPPTDAEWRMAELSARDTKNKNARDTKNKNARDNNNKKKRKINPGESGASKLIIETTYRVSRCQDVSGRRELSTLFYKLGPAVCALGGGGCGALRQ